MEAGQTFENIQEIKIKGSDAFIALLKSFVKEQSLFGNTDAYILTILGMQKELEKMGYNLEEDWDPFIEGIVIPVTKSLQKK